MSFRGAAAILALGAAAALALVWVPSSPSVTRAAPRAQVTQPPASLPERYIFAGEWGSQGDRQGLDHPTGIALGSDGKLFVAERGGDRISVWGISGRAVATWGGTAQPGRFSSPIDVALDEARSRLYVAEPAAGRVQVLDPESGAPIAVIEDVGAPSGLATADDGRLFVADGPANLIRVFDADGVALPHWGDLSGTEALRNPGGLAWSNGQLFVADRDNLRIQVLDEGGLALPALAIDLAAGEVTGRPLDIAAADGKIYIALEHGIVRTTPGGTTFTEMPPLEEHVPPGCRQCELCRELRPVVANHEGVGGVAAKSGVAMAFSYAPSLRAGDRIVIHPERGFPDVFPTWACAPIPARQLHDPFRVDAGEAPELAHVLDRSGRARILDERGAFFDATRGRSAPVGADIAADGDVPYHTAVLTGNQVAVGSLRCFLGCGAAEVAMADERSLQRRDRVGELIPDYTWWHRALAFRGPLALLDAGRARIVLRQGFPCGAIDVPFCTDRTCHRQQECPVNPTDRPLLGGESLRAARDPFRAFSDLAYDPAGTLWVLARDGTVVGLDRFGRSAGEVALLGLGQRSLEALAVDATGFYVLGSDGRISKHLRDGSLRAAWFPHTEGGPGLYVDLSVAPDGRVLVVDQSGQRLLLFAPSPGPAPPPDEPPLPGCHLTLSKSAAPDPVLLGERIDIRLGLELSCPPRDIVIAVDGSCQMAGSRLAAARSATRALLAELDLNHDRVGLAIFDDRPGGWRSVAALGSSAEDLDAAAAALPSNCRPVQLFPERRNDARIAEGLRAGRQLLFGPGSRDDARKVLVLSAASTIDRQHVEAEAGRALAGQQIPLVRDREHAIFESRNLWRSGVRIHTFGLGMPDRPLGPPPQPTPDLQSSQPADEGILAAVAQPASAYALADPPGQLTELWRTMAADWHDSDRIESLEVTDLLPDDMRLIQGSAVPSASPVTDGLTWQLGTLRSGQAITLTLAVTPTVSGLRATNAEAVAAWRSTYGAPEQATFPVPVVRVIVPTPTATPSPTATASPTSSSTPEATTVPTAEATPTTEPTATTRPSAPTAGPRRLFLPAALQHRCKPVAVALDVVLLLDSSSSMQGAKLDAARQASGIFLTLLELGRDRVALVRFDRADEVLVPLTADGDAIRIALRDLRTDVGTRIDLGLVAATDLLSAAKRPRTDQVIVLLTDGRPELGSENEAVRVAASARAAGVSIWAVGLGREVPVSLLDAITGDPTRVRLAPDAGGLVAIYESIARLLPCR